MSRAILPEINMPFHKKFKLFDIVKGIAISDNLDTVLKVCCETVLIAERPIQIIIYSFTVNIQAKKEASFFA